MPPHSQVVDRFAFLADWAWGLPLIVLTVVIHVVGLGFVSQRAVHVSRGLTERRHSKAAFVVLMGVATLLATCLHGPAVTPALHDSFGGQFLGVSATPLAWP